MALTADSSSESSAPSGASINLVVLDLGVFVCIFLFRFLTVDFKNDHFAHLSRARQILLGDLPVRDFFDGGFFLQNYASTAAQLAFGYNLFGEALLTISLVALGGMLAFHLSARLSGSRLLAGGAALLTALSFPRLYAYPKVTRAPPGSVSVSPSPTGTSCPSSASASSSV